MTAIDPSHPDPSTLASYLSGHLPGFSGPVSVEKFTDGQSNPTFLLSTPERCYVLRRKPPGRLLASAHAVDREYRLLTGLQGSRVPVPTPCLLCTDESVLGSQFYVMSHEPGDIFWDPALPGQTREGRGERYHALIDTLAALHDVDHHAVGLGDFGRPGNYYARQLDRWTRQYRAATTVRIPEMDALIRWLEARLPDDDGQHCLIHGDYRLDNVIFHPGEPRIRAVLDWELATTGHPLADLAYYCMALRMPREGEIRGLQGLDRERLNIPGETALISRYCQRRGLEGISHWPFCLAFSFFRLAAILQGVYQRGLDGNASSDRAIRMGRLVEPLVVMGLQATRESSERFAGVNQQ
jgi:aminoglycoside phosphotransferase (APT) family kinase protein